MENSINNFISSKPNSDETLIMHTKSNNIEIMITSDTDEVIEDLFISLLQRYQKKIRRKNERFRVRF